MNAEEVGELTERGHSAGKCPGFMDITEHPEAFRFQFDSTIQWATRPLTHEDSVPSVLTSVSSGRMLERVIALEAYQNRYYSGQFGVQSAAWLKGVFEELSKGRDDISIREVKHNFDQPSLIVTLQGQGPHRDEVLVVGAHQDSITGWGSSTKRAPGADDNASGVATVLEVFHVLMSQSFQSDRTIEFMLYAGEEKGLLGSQDIAQEYAKAHKKVVGAIQFDMTMDGGTENTITFMTDFVDSNLTGFLQKLTAKYLTVKWGTSKCGYGCSDHASWFRSGYSAAIPFESKFELMHDRLHTLKDTSGFLNAEFGAQFAKLGLAFVLEAHEDSSKWGEVF
jgi:leucyl aminopeptidase